MTTGTEYDSGKGSAATVRAVMRALMKSTLVEEIMHTIEAVMRPYLSISSPTLSDMADVFKALHVPFDATAAEEAGYQDCFCVSDGAR